MDAKWTKNTTDVFVNTSEQSSPAIAVAGLTTAYAVLLLLSLIGNTLVLVIIYRDRRLRTNVNLFIANMAASDLLFPTFAIPYRISSILSGGKWIVHGALGEALCKIVTFTGDISNLVSVLCLVAIAADRFDAIVYPMSSQLITKKVRSVILISTWILSVLFFCPYFYAMKLRSGKNNAMECLFTWGTDAKTTFLSQRKYIFVNFAFFIALPFLILLVLYSIIIFSLFRQSSTLVLSTKERKQHMNENRRIALMSFIVVIVFIVTYAPLNIYFFIIFVNGTDFIFNETFFLVSYFLSLVYPAANPIIYYIFHEKYRQGFHRIFRFCCKFYNKPRKSSRLKQLERGLPEHQTIELMEFLN